MTTDEGRVDLLKVNQRPAPVGARIVVATA